MSSHDNETSTTTSGYVKKAGKFVFVSAPKFLFITIPSRSLGLPTLVSSSKMFKQQFNYLKNPVCLYCYKGVFVPQALPDSPQNTDIKPANIPSIQSQEQSIPWECTSCQARIIGSNNLKKLQQELLPEAHIRAKARLENMTPEARTKLMNGHYTKSKFYAVTSCLLFIVAILLVGLGYLLAGFQWLLFSAVGMLMALKAGYRGWQVLTGNIFMPKSMFMEYVKHAKWFAP